MANDLKGHKKDWHRWKQVVPLTAITVLGGPLVLGLLCVLAMSAFERRAGLLFPCLRPRLRQRSARPCALQSAAKGSSAPQRGRTACIQRAHAPEHRRRYCITGPVLTNAQRREFQIDGRTVAVWLEATYWKALTSIARREGKTVGELISQAVRGFGPRQGSATLRRFTREYFRARGLPFNDGPAPTSC
jgi:hypothetical protein